MKLAYRALFVMLLGALSLPVLAGGLFSSTTSITEPTPVASDYLGYADNTGVAYSADGQTALVAASYATVGTATQAGKAYFWHYANGKWTMMQEIDDPDDAARDFFGYSIALSADGKTALIGSEAAVSGAQYAGKPIYIRSATAPGPSHMNSTTPPRPRTTILASPAWRCRATAAPR